jgi:hypothetical protein
VNTTSDFLENGVVWENLPFSTLSIARNGIFSSAVFPEIMTGPTSVDLIHPILGAIFRLLGRTDGMYGAILSIGVKCYLTHSPLKYYR